MAENYALRSAIQFMTPFLVEFKVAVKEMEDAFEQVIVHLKAPVEKLEIPIVRIYFTLPDIRVGSKIIMS